MGLLSALLRGARKVAGKLYASPAPKRGIGKYLVKPFNWFVREPAQAVARAVRRPNVRNVGVAALEVLPFAKVGKIAKVGKLVKVGRGGRAAIKGAQKLGGSVFKTPIAKKVAGRAAGVAAFGVAAGIPLRTVFKEAPKAALSPLGYAVGKAKDLITKFPGVAGLVGGGLGAAGVASAAKRYFSKDKDLTPQFTSGYPGGISGLPGGYTDALATQSIPGQVTPEVKPKKKRAPSKRKPYKQQPITINNVIQNQIIK